MQKITRKRILAVGVVSAFIVLIFAIVKTCNGRKGNVYDYDKVTLGTVQKTISVPGVIDIIDPFRVLGKTSGVVTHVYADFNQEVRKGQLLATLDSTDIDQRLAKIGAQLESTKLELAIAKDDLEAKKSMYKDNLISEKGMERARYNYKTVQNKYKQALVDYDIARGQKADTRITAPVSGVIISRNIEENAPAPAGTPLFVIAPTLKRMRLTISIDESDIGQVKKGQSVTFTVSAYPDKTFRGTINQVRMNPVTKGSVVTYDSLVVCENDGLLLKPGMTATATIVVGKRSNVLRVPNQAFIVSPVNIPMEERKSIVWKKAGGMAGGLPIEKVKVVTGLQGDNYTEIVKNLKKGDEVLVKFIRGSER
jgi:HlyD family secretion protein